MHKTFIIQGTHCAGCKGLLEDVINDVPGVKSVTVDPQNGKTELDFDETLDFGQLKNEVTGAGHYRIEE